MGEKVETMGVAEGVDVGIDVGAFVGDSVAACSLKVGDATGLLDVEVAGQTYK